MLTAECCVKLVSFPISASFRAEFSLSDVAYFDTSSALLESIAVKQYGRLQLEHIYNFFV